MSHLITETDRPLDNDRLTEKLLQGTSRTFALAIPLLALERRRQVGLAYLLFRVADSIEDAPNVDAATKISLLRDFLLALETQTKSSLDDGIAPDLAGLTELWPSDSATAELLQETPRLIRMLNETSSAAANTIRTALNRTAGGMIQFLTASQSSSRQIQIRTISELQFYCYVVAGIVGEMLTDLFVSQHSANATIRKELLDLSTSFGEFLQLINILKDVDTDVLDGRIFIPGGIDRDSILDLASTASTAAERYICLLAENEFPADVVNFCKFLFQLAEATLGRLKVPAGPNKLTRDEVMRLLNAI